MSGEPENEGWAAPSVGDYWQHRQRRHDEWARHWQRHRSRGWHGPGGWRHPRTRGPIRRRTEGRMVAGVASGIGAKTGLSPTLVRVAFICLGLADGSGFALYVIAWLLIPREGESASIARRAFTNRSGIVQAVAFATVLLAILIVFEALGLTFLAGVIWPASVGAAGLVLVWQGAEEDERSFLRAILEQSPLVSSSGKGSTPATIARVIFGLVLVLSGLLVLVTVARPTVTTEVPIVAAIIVIAGLLVVFGPWWLRIVRDMSHERQERVRSQERADLAVRVHDSVLQTLALVQRAAHDPQEVVRLARVQERELRAWLFEGRAPGSFDGTEASTLSEAVSLIGHEVEESHGISVDAVVVGDCPLDDTIEAVLAAGKEATVNAAKWSGVQVVSLYVEVEAAKVSFFVRDRGRGFDPEAVAEDRRGISESIRARMARFGGEAHIRSVPAEGTEVELVMPRQKVPA